MKKGFTLIELLAVILILGIIALIAIPTVTGVIEDSKKGALKSSATNIAKVAEQQCNIEKIGGKEITKLYTIENGKLSSNLDIKNLPQSGAITVNDECEASVAISDNGYCSIKEEDTISINTNTYNCRIDYVDIPETTSSCFIFDETTHTITGYNFADATCPTDVSIPATINNIPVEKIAPGAFINLSLDYDYILYFDIPVLFENTYNSSDLNIENIMTSITTPEFDIIQNSNNNNLSSYILPIRKIVETPTLTKKCYYNLEKTIYDEQPFDYIIKDDDEYLNCSIDIMNDPETLFSEFEVGEVESELSMLLFTKLLSGIFFEEFDLDEIFPRGKITGVDFSKAINLTDINGYAFMYNRITKVNFGNLPRLIHIGKEAFANNLIGDVLNLNGLTGINRISLFQFSNNNIQRVMIPNNIEVIGVGAFKDNNIDILNFSSNIKTIEIGAFAKNVINSVTFSNGIEILGDMSFISNNISKIEIPNSVTYLSGFAENNISSIDIPSSVAEIGYAAFAANLINEVYIPSNVEVIGDYAFSDNLISSLTLNEGLKRIEEGAFSRCDCEEEVDGISNLTIPSTVISIGDYAFSNNDISTVTIPSNVTYLSGFDENNISSIIIPSSVTEIGYAAFAINNISSITLPENLEKINDYAFYNNDISVVNIPNKVKYLSGFSYNNLTSINIPESVTEIGSSAFAHNSISGTLTIPSSVTEIGYDAFDHNSISGTLTIPANVTTLERFSFSNNYITSLVLNEGLVTIDSMAFTDNKITTVNGSSSITKATLPSTVQNVLGGAFATNRLTGNNRYVYLIQEGVTYNNILGSYAGYKEQNIEITANVDTIASYAFNNVNASVTLPNTVKTLDSYAFCNVHRQGGILSIPSSIISIGADAFYCDYSPGNYKYCRYNINIAKPSTSPLKQGEPWGNEYATVNWNG